MKKRFFLSACMALVLGAMPAMAQQDNDNDGNRPNRAEMIEKQANKLAKDFKLDGSKKSDFVTLFTQYQNDLTGSMKRPDGQRDRQQAGQNDKKELSDAEATAKIQEEFARQQKQIENQQNQLTVKKAYYEKFSAMLTPQQTLKVLVGQRNRQQQRGNNQGGRGMGGMGGRGMGGFGGMGGPGGDF